MTNNSLQNEGKMNLSKELGSIPYPAILPPLSYDLQYMLKNDGILKAQRHFIAFWGQYLWQTTHTKPTKQDYNNLASSIVAAYPQLAGGKNGCVSNVNTQYLIVNFVKLFNKNVFFNRKLLEVN